MLKWHSSRTKPKAYEDIFIIWRNGEITRESTTIDGYGKLGIDTPDGYDNWEDNVKDLVVRWQYATKVELWIFEDINLDDMAYDKRKEIETYERRNYKSIDEIP